MVPARDTFGARLFEDSQLGIEGVSAAGKRVVKVFFGGAGA